MRLKRAAAILSTFRVASGFQSSRGVGSRYILPVRGVKLSGVVPAPPLLSLKAPNEGGVGDPDSAEHLISSAKAAEDLVRSYFSFWNDRDMSSAVLLFSEDVEYEDTQYPSAFRGRSDLSRHLDMVSRSLPPTFSFVVDLLSSSASPGNVTVGVQWHVENEGRDLPFARGCSMYVVEGGEIKRGFDVPEPAPIKQGNFGLGVLSVASNDGIIPGASATQLEARTWDEVLGLSLNFFLVAPMLSLPFSPSLHPGLEGIFNLLLSWAAMFSGFAATERGPGEEGRLGSYGKALVGMQVGCSFLVDLVVFGIFQGWMVDDDMRRRGVGGEGGREPTEVERLGVGLAKFVPFIGLSSYLLLRPPLQRGGADK
ncbi:hypothetical protein TrRE_jg12706 [Triparma retinervis]|uniref:SnoaL-like domain-containing protein n=1 Tax=Triparma retinervis TaxID=2557542 RepID=A0A9W7A1W3_9STRA|nr:hypothetical protein TrRE_jg12706 [Triparma retinervis]